MPCALPLLLKVGIKGLLSVFPFEILASSANNFLSNIIESFLFNPEIISVFELSASPILTFLFCNVFPERTQMIRSYFLLFSDYF
jgi:hypothetical protein